MGEDKNSDELLDFVENPIDPNYAPKTPELEPMSLEEIEDFPLPEKDDIDALLGQNETCLEAYNGRVDGVHESVVYATLVDEKGGYTTSELNPEFFSSKPSFEATFLLLKIKDTEDHCYHKLKVREPVDGFLPPELVEKMRKAEDS